ncbi:MAG: SGNH/GDSL hydrolase family protein [Nocardioidaceae bacterium]
MGKARAARRLASAAAFGGGGLGLIGGGLFGVMKLEAALARRTIGDAMGDPPDPDGVYGPDFPGTPLTLLVLGDSAAAGYGMNDPIDTPPAMLGHGLAQIAGAPVRVVSQAYVGARTQALAGQIDGALQRVGLPDIAVIVVGVNDVTHTVRPAESVRLLDAAVRGLVDLGISVVVGTCPDLGTVGPLAPPLRQVARAWSRRLAAAQTIVVVEAGGRSVSLGSLLGPEFAAAPTELFGADRFHPSLAGYASMVAALLPSVASSLGLWEDDLDEDPASGGISADVIGAQRNGVLPVSFAAAAAASRDGTEVSRTAVGGRERGTRGRWAQVTRRRRRTVPPVAQPDVRDSPATA